MADLHERLIALQATSDLVRKAEKACRWRGKIWTQEELDYAFRRAEEFAKYFALPHTTEDR